MKFKLLLVVTGMSLLLLTGCGSSISLTDNETSIVAEYVGGLVLKYDKNYEDSLIVPEDILEEDVQATVTPTPTTAPSDEGVNNANDTVSKDSNKQANADFTEVIGIEGLTVEYSGYKTSDNYSDPYFTIESGDGKQLLIVGFDVKNTTKKDVAMNLGNSDISYQLDINTGTFQKPLLTFLDNDLRLIDTTVEANSTLKTVLVFNVSDKINLDVVNVIISRGDKTAIVKLK